MGFIVLLEAAGKHIEDVLPASGNSLFDERQAVRHPGQELGLAGGSGVRRKALPRFDPPPRNALLTIGRGTSIYLLISRG